MTRESTFVIVTRPRPVGLFSMDEVAHRCGVHNAFIEKLVRLGVIDPHPEYPRYFEPRVSVRIRKIIRLRHDLNINIDGAAVILDLLDRIEQLEAELRRRHAP